MVEILKQNETNIWDIILEGNLISIGTLSIQISVRSPHRSQIGSMKWSHGVFCQFQPFQMLGSHSRLGASQMPSYLPLLSPLPVLLLCDLVLPLQMFQALPYSWPLYLLSLWSKTIFTHRSDASSSMRPFEVALLPMVLLPLYFPGFLSQNF